MAEYTLNARVRHARKPEATWTSENPVLLQDEIGFVKETGRFKIGDGTTAWNSLSYATVDPIAHSATLITSGTLNSSRLPTVPVSKGGTGATTLASGKALIGNGTGAVTTRTITNITAKGALGWTSDLGANLVNLNTLAYWNGAYSGTSSNLSYCNRGAFGTIVTKAAGDYLAVGGTAVASKKLANYYSARQESANLTADGSGGVINFKATSSMKTGKPMADGHILHFYWDNNSGWDAQFFVPNGNANNYAPQWRGMNNKTWQDWRTFLDSGNYSSYALPLTGGTLTGNLYIKKGKTSVGAHVYSYNSSGTQIGQIDIYGNSLSGLFYDAINDVEINTMIDIDGFYIDHPLNGIAYLNPSGLYLSAGIATIGGAAYFKTATNYFYNGSYYTAINRPSASANYTLYLPSATGQLVYHTNDTAIGGAAKPVYIAASGAATACSSTVGSTSKPVYMKSGTITALSATVGSSSRPMYSNAGTLTAITAVSTSYGGTGATTVDGALTNLNAVGVYGRSSISTTINLDNPGVNGFFELRGTSEVNVSGTRPSSSWIPFLSLKSPDNIVMLQLAGSGASFYLRGNQAGSVTLSDVAWQTILVSGNYTDYVVPKTGGTFSGTVKFGSQLHLWSDSEGGNIRLFTKTSTTNCFEFDGYDGNLRLYYSTNSGSGASTAWSWKTNGLFMTPYLGVNGNNTSYRLYVVGTSYLSSTVTSAGEFISTSANGFRITQGNYGAFFRNDGGAFYLLFTASGSQTGSWNGLRPFTANLSNGYVTIGNGLGVGAADTGYTFNVTGTSRFSGKMTLFGSVNASNGNAPFNGAIEVREAGQVGATQSAITYAPKIGFHWGGRVASALALHSDNYFYRVSNNGTAYKIVDKACFSLSGTTLTITV